MLILLDKIWRLRLLTDLLMQHLDKISFSWRMAISGFTRIKNMVNSMQRCCFECHKLQGIFFYFEVVQG